MSRKKPQMGVMRPLIRGYKRLGTDTIKFGRPMEEVLASLRGPYTTVLVEGGVEYSVPTESLWRGAYDRRPGVQQ